MKKISMLILSISMLTAFIPTVYANSSVTAEDVKKATAKTSIVNNVEDYEIFKSEIKDENILAENVYTEYSTSYYDSSKKSSIRTAETANPKKDKISDVIFDTSASYRGFEYIYRSNSDDYYTGSISFHNRGKSPVYAYTSVFDEKASMRLFFSHDELAKVLSENNIAKPEKIMYLVLDYSDYISDGYTFDGAIIVATANKEYALVNIQYNNNELSDYLLLDSETFIESICGKQKSLRDALYEKFKPENAPVFSDVSNDSAVSMLARMGIVNGYEDGTFGCENYITRAEASKMIALLRNNRMPFDTYDREADEWSTFDFSDVPMGHWARKYILYGVVQGYIHGKGEVTGKMRITKQSSSVSINGNIIPPSEKEIFIDLYNFCPEDNVTEQELAKMIVCAIDFHAETMAQAEGGWPDGYIAVAKRLGIHENASDKPATRIDAAHMIKNALDAEVFSPGDETYSIEQEYSENGVIGIETVIGKETYYHHALNLLGYKRIKLSGKITKKLRDNEYNFIVSQDEKAFSLDYKKGDMITFLSKYGDLDDFIDKECDIYFETICGIPLAIMAE